MKNNSTNKEAKSPWRPSPGSLFILLVAALVLGIGIGVGCNLLLAKNPPRAKEATATEVKKESRDAQSNGEAPNFDNSNAMRHVFTFSQQIGTRPACSAKESQAADYLAQQLGDCGYSVEEQAFSLSGNLASRNIVAKKRGSKEGYVLIIGAHYDSSIECEGALDNASGAGVVLELARIFSQAKLLPEIRFVFFGSNGPGLASSGERMEGSKHFVEMLGSMEKEEVIGMISVDGVGTGDQLMLMTQGDGPQGLKNKLETFFRKKLVNVRIDKSENDSDNLPFEKQEIPAVWLRWGEGEVGSGDQYALVESKKIEETGEFLAAFISGLVEKDLRELKY